jgi:hypothetical protein
MKKLAMIVIFSLVAVFGARGQMLSKGTVELDLSGSFDDKTPSGNQVWIGLGVGYFVIDNLELIAAGYFSHDDYVIGYHPAVGAQYNFNLGYKLVPFIGANLGWGIWDYKKGGEDMDGFVYGGEAGVKYFVTESLALAVSLDYDLSTGDIWMEEGGKMVNNNWGVRWGLRYFI